MAAGPRSPWRTPAQAFLCTDLDAAAVDILQWFVSRWQLEVTFQDSRAHLGVETQRQWSDLAILRSGTGSGAACLNALTAGAIFAVNDGLVEVVRGSLTGSVVGNLLLVLGFSLIVGPTKEIDRRSGLISVGLVLGATLLFMDRAFGASARRVNGPSGSITGPQDPPRSG